MLSKSYRIQGLFPCIVMAGTRHILDNIQGDQLKTGSSNSYILRRIGIMVGDDVGY